MYSNTPSRAGLVTLILALIISLVSAVPVPIPAPQFGLSSTLSYRSNHDRQDLIQRNTGQIAQILRSGPISTASATTGALTGNNIPIDLDNQLVRRNKRLNAKIRAGFKKLGHGIKHVAQKIGHGIKKAAKAVGNFVKHTAGKVAKFGLKIISTAQKVAAKVVGFIPGIGKPLGKALEGASRVTGLISDKIHANLGKKLEKGMKAMNKANKVMGYIPRRRDLSEEEGFQQRDISDAYYFEERDDIPLEHREESYFDVDERDIYERAFDYYLDSE